MGLFLVLIFIFNLTEAARAVTVGATYDADTYYFTGTYNEIRTGTLNSGTFHVGQHILATDPVYDGHFNFAAVRFADLSAFAPGEKKYLSLNVRDFKTPMAVDPGYQGPPVYSYLPTGNFRLAIVALGADFTETETTSNLPGWYTTNLYSRTPIAQVDVTSAGIFQVDVTAAVDNWISTPATNFGFGLVGISSDPQATTVRFYSMESAGFGPVLIPEPRTASLLVLALVSLVCLRPRRHFQS